MRFFDFFAGIGGFRLGMEMAGHECVGHCEIDKYADMSYRAMHHLKESEVYFNDIRTVRASDMPECECYCFGFPCQAFSIAGQRRGFADTRGTLFFEVMRLAKERQPQILFAENVAGLLNHEGGVTFGIIISAMAELGYSVEWQVLDSQNFGVPQHRERVFIIGHLGGRGAGKVFPIRTDGATADGIQRQRDTDRVICNTLLNGDRNAIGTYVATDRQTDRQTEIPQGKRLSQVIEVNMVNETIKHKTVANTLDTKSGEVKGFRTNYVIEKMSTLKQINKGYADHKQDRIYHEGGVSPALASSNFGHDIKVAINMKVKNQTKEGYIECPIGGVMDLAFPDSEYRRGRVINNGQTTNTLDTGCNIGLNVDDYRIRKLTPKECFRLQGFPDEYFERAAEVCSDSQLYKQAGNSVTVNVIYEIAKRLE